MDCEPREAEGGAVGGGYQGYCVSSMFFAQREHHKAEIVIRPCGAGQALLLLPGGLDIVPEMG